MSTDHDTDHDWVTTPVTADLLRGFLDVEATAHGLLPHRLPARARRQIPDDQLAERKYRQKHRDRRCHR